jgi:predicted metal-dependent phosphotriesterase family hydrolase
MHEHVLFGNIPGDLRSASADIAVHLLNEASRVGIDTIVDLTPVRDIVLYQQIAGQTPVKIIVSTGFYLQSHTPEWQQKFSERQMEEHMIREVTEGIEETKIHAGIIKLAGGGIPLTDWEKMTFRAAARVHQSTKIPIQTHAVCGSREQFDLLAQSGVDPHQIILSHVETVSGWEGRNREQMAEYLLAIAKEGGNLLFNNFGCDFYTPPLTLVYLLRSLFEKGFGHRVFGSVDCNWEWKNRRQVYEAEDVSPEAAKRTYAYMITDVVPQYLKFGMSKKEWDILLVRNPRQFFSRS